METLPSVLVSGVLFLSSGCYLRIPEDSASPYAQYVGRHAEIKKEVVIYDLGAGGRLGVPLDGWRASQKVLAVLQPGGVLEITGVFSRRIESEKHYYLECRYNSADVDVVFDFPADDRFMGANHLNWK